MAEMSGLQGSGRTNFGFFPEAPWEKSRGVEGWREKPPPPRVSLSSASNFLHLQQFTFPGDLLYNVDIEAAFEGPLNQVSGLNWG